MLKPEGDKSRSVSRSREPDSDEELPSSKVPKPSPLSPPHVGESSEGWPALPSPGGKKTTPTRKESPGTTSPRKVPQPKSPKGATSPQEDNMAPEGPVSQPPLASQPSLISSQLKNPLVQAKGPKERPQESGHMGVSNKGTKEASKPQGSLLKAPLARPQGSTSKGDSKVNLKSKQ